MVTKELYMNNPLTNCDYDKVKILHELSCMLWFIKKHALVDVQQDDEFSRFLKRLESDLEKHVEELNAMVCK